MRLMEVKDLESKVTRGVFYFEGDDLIWLIAYDDYQNEVAENLNIFHELGYKTETLTEVADVYSCRLVKR